MVSCHVIQRVNRVKAPQTDCTINGTDADRTTAYTTTVCSKIRVRVAESAINSTYWSLLPLTQIYHCCAPSFGIIDHYVPGSREFGLSILC